MGKDETIESSACTQQAHDAAGGPEVQEPDKSSENTRTLEEEGEEKEGSDVGIETLLDKTGRKEGQGVYEDSEKRRRERRILKLLQIQDTLERKTVLVRASTQAPFRLRFIA